MFSEMVLPHVGTMNENQLILITLLGIKSLQRLVTHLEDLVSRYNGRVLEIENCGGDPRLSQSLQLEKIVQLKFFKRLALFLNVCMNAPSPETVRVLQELKIGQKLSQLLTQIDPDLHHKNLHVSLTKFFGTLCDSEITNLKNLVIDFEYTISPYQRNLKKNNLLSCQYDSIFMNMGKFWCSSFLEYVRRNFAALKDISERRPVVELMLKTYVDEKGNFVTTNPEDSLLKKSSEDICMHSESPRSYQNFEGLADFTGYSGLGLSFLDNSYKGLPNADGPSKNSDISEGKNSIRDFSLDEDDSSPGQTIQEQMPNMIEDPTLLIEQESDIINKGDDKSQAQMTDEEMDYLDCFGNSEKETLPDFKSDVDTEMFSDYMKNSEDDSDLLIGEMG